jgi:prepilin-type N-terminal cleavage/methylation domain-containing protein
VKQLRARLRRERGYSLIEMLITLVIMGIVMGSLTTVFVSASNSEADLNNRFQAQLTARLALDKLRREVHCATVATPADVASSPITLTLPSYCKTLPQPLSTPIPSYCATQIDGSVSCTITWCTESVATNRYALYRVTGSTCSGGVKWADYFVSTSTAATCGSPTALCIFTFTHPTSSRAKLHVDLPVNVKPSRTTELYELIDDIVLRNSLRA